MASLIENVLSIENQANEIIAKAQAESKNLEKTALAEIERVRQEIDAQTEQRIEAFRADTAKTHEATLAQEKQLAEEQMASLDRLEPGLAQKLAGPIAAKLREH